VILPAILDPEEKAQTERIEAILHLQLFTPANLKVTAIGIRKAVKLRAILRLRLAQRFER